MLTLDHLAVAGETLAAAQAHVETALAAPMQTGGEHAVFHTHNTLIGLEDALYLEAIAINPAAPLPTRPRWFDLDRFAGPPRLTNWICRCDDLDATLAAIPVDAGQPVDLQRGDLRWRMAVPTSGVLPFDNLFPALIEWQTDDTPPGRLAPTGVRLAQLTVSHPDAQALSDLLAPVLDDPRVRFVQGDPGLQAHFDTPQGPRML